MCVQVDSKEEITKGMKEEGNGEERRKEAGYQCFFMGKKQNKYQRKQKPKVRVLRRSCTASLSVSSVRPARIPTF